MEEIGKMAFLHFFIKKLLNFILHILWIFPLKKNRILLLNELSFKYGDNLKYLNEYIKKNVSDNFEVIFPLIDKKEAKDNNLRYVKPFSLLYFKFLLTSGIVITNAGGISYIPIRKKQLVINTWHGGGPYKKTGGTLFQNKWYLKELQMQRKNVKYMVSSCKICTENENKAMLYEEEACLPFGMPRNDIFFDNTLPLRNKVFKQYGLNENDKLILFAPTFRTNPANFTDSKKYHVSDIDYEKLLDALNRKFGGVWKFAIRLHPKLRNKEIDVPNALNFTTYPDMQELLYAADVVITDFSSLMWDFSLTKRPCLLYADDIDEYEREHGFYMPSKQWPYPIAKNNDELIKNIETFNLEKYQKDVEKHYEECGSYEKGTACESIFNMIKANLE